MQSLLDSFWFKLHNNVQHKYNCQLTSVDLNSLHKVQFNVIPIILLSINTDEQ